MSRTGSIDNSVAGIRIVMTGGSADEFGPLLNIIVVLMLHGGSVASMILTN
jgi:hypothetical protein